MFICSVIEQNRVLACLLLTNFTYSTTWSAYCSLDTHPSPDLVAASFIGVICLLKSCCRNDRGGDQLCRAVILNCIPCGLASAEPAGWLDRAPGN